MNVLRFVTMCAACAGLLGGCAEGGKTHLIGSLAYEGADANVERRVPAEADPQVAKCVGESTLKGSEDRGIKTDKRITPPFFVGLWPAPRAGAPEIHGRVDVPSVGKPLPGDHPFLKTVVCTLGVDLSYDWTIEERFDGSYYIAAWFDRDMNGYPGVDEPLGFYRGEGTAPVAVKFDSSEAQRLDIVIGALAEPFEEQAEAIREDLEQSLRTLDLELFSTQFQPLYFKDPFNRTINQIDELYADLTTDVNKASNRVGWLNGVKPSQTKAGATGSIELVQTKNPAAWSLNQNLKTNVSVQMATGLDGIYQLSDWKPLLEQSGDLTPSATPPTNFDGTADLTFAVELPAAAGYGLWYALERFWASESAPAGGTWSTLTTSQAWTGPLAGKQSIVIGPTYNTAVDPAALIRLTVLPIGGALGYPQWVGGPAAVTEPTRGNYLRFYAYGNNYVYRRVPPKK